MERQKARGKMERIPGEEPDRKRVFTYSVKKTAQDNISDDREDEKRSLLWKEEIRSIEDFQRYLETIRKSPAIRSEVLVNWDRGTKKEPDKRKEVSKAGSSLRYLREERGRKVIQPEQRRKGRKEEEKGGGRERDRTD